MTNKFELDNMIIMRKKYYSITTIALLLISIFGVILAVRKDLSPTEPQAAVISFAELEEAGLYSVLDPRFGTCSNNGSVDCTRAIQNAIDQAFASSEKESMTRGAVLFPTGDYLISDTLVIVTDRKMARKNAVQLIGSTAGTRPRLILAPNKFNDGIVANDSNITNKKAMVHFFGCISPSDDNDEVKTCNPLWSDQRNNVGRAFHNVTDGNPAMAMTMGVRNLDFVVNTGNPDSIAIRFAGAQDNILSKVGIEFKDTGLAGIYSFIGTNSVVEDIKIKGGKYGFMGGDSRWPTLTNIRLENQTVAAISGSNGGMPLSINGFYIEKDSAPAIADVGINYSYFNGSNSGGAYALSDGIIKIRTSSTTPVIDNRGDRQVTMNNVYIHKATTVIVNSGVEGDRIIGNPNGWMHIKTYGSTMKDIISGNKTNKSANIKDGVKLYDHTEGYIINPYVSTVDENAITQMHSVSSTRLPSPDVIISKSKDHVPGYIYLKHRGVNPLSSTSKREKITAGTDLAPQIQTAINSCNETYCFILMGKGLYPLKSTIDLKSNTHLFGVTNYLTEIVTNPSWRTTTQTPVLRSPNIANAKTALGYFKMNYNTNPNVATFNLIHWRSGSDSFVYGLGSTRTFPLTKYSYNLYKPRSEILITDNGGGKWYGLNTSGNGIINKWIPNYRGIKVMNTTQNLTFYGLDPEDAGYNCLLDSGACTDSSTATYPPSDSQSMQVEIRNAQNVSIRGMKCEDHNSVNIFDSSNIYANGIGGCTDWYLENVDRYLILNLASKFNASGRAGEENLITFEEKFGNSLLTVYKDESLSWISRGDVLQGL